MGMGALMELMAESQTTTPEYAPEQIARHGTAHSRKNIDKPAYLMSDPIKDGSGNVIASGPIALHQPSQVGSGLMAALNYTATAMQAMSGEGQSTLPSSVSGEAVRQVNQRQDDAFQPLMQNAMQATKALCKVWIPAAQELYFSNQRSLRVISQDGSISQVETMQIEERDGIVGPFKNSARGKYDVSIKAGESHQSLKEAELKSATEILQYTTTETAIGQMALLTAVQATTGEGTQAMRSMARMNEIKMLMAEGLDPKPRTDEENQYVQSLIQQQQEAAQQPKQPSPAEAESIARMKEGEAAVMNEQNDALKLKIDYEIKSRELAIEEAKLQLKAQEIGATIELKSAQSANQRIDAITKVQGVAQI
jgi:hypothetical protein